MAISEKVDINKLLFNSFQIPMSFHNKDGILLESNRAYNVFCNCKDDGHEQSIYDLLCFLNREVIDLLISADDHVFKYHKDYDFNFSYIHSNGGLRLILCIKKILISDDGAVLGIVTSYEEITERRELEMHLKSELEFNLSIIDTVGALVLIMDKDYNILKANSVAKKTSGYNELDMINHKFEDIFISEGNRGYFNKKTSRSSPLVKEEFVLLTKNGETRHIMWTIRRMKGVDVNSLSYIIASGSDVTNYKIAEKRVVDRERILSAILESTDEIMVLINSEGKILAHNNSFSSFMGKHREDFISRGYYDLLPESLAEERKKYINEAMEQSIKVTFHDQLNSRYYLNNAFSVEGRVDLVVIYSKDVTHKKSLEKEAESQRRCMIQADKLDSLSTLVLGIAYDINNPCSFIAMNAPILQDAWNSLIPILDEYVKVNGDIDLGGLTFNDLRDELPALCEDMKRGSDRISASIIEFENYIIEKPVDYMKPVSVNDIIRLTILLSKNKIDKSTDNFSCNLQNRLPKVSVNPQRFQHAVINILINSCNSLNHPSEGISVSTEYNHTSRKVHIVIKNEGAGFDANSIANFFKPLSIGNRYEGMSYSVAVANNLIKENGGDLTVESKLGKGAEFLISLPICK